MKRVYAAHQPTIFPATRLIERFSRCHDVVVLREAQFDRATVQVHFYDQKQQRPLMVSPDLIKSNRKPYSSIELESPERFAAKLRSAAQSLYRQKEGYVAARGSWDELLDRVGKSKTLEQVAWDTLSWTFLELGIKTNLHKSTDMVPNRPNSPADWMVSFAAPMVATHYLGGAGMLAYGAHEACFARGVTPMVQDFVAPLPNLSILDALFFYGRDKVREMLNVEAGPDYTDSYKELKPHGG